MERLDKVVSTAAYLSRKDSGRLIRLGAVTVDGRIIKDSSFKVDAEKSVITFEGKKIEYKKYVYIMLNKPAGVISASDGKDRFTVVDIVYETVKRQGLFPVGRLDKDTTGLLIISDDGDFGHRVISPNSHIEKEYTVSVDKPITAEDTEKLESGVTLVDGTVLRPAKVKILSDDKMQISVTITEGKYHEIKRMLGTVGAGVIKLKRERIGGLTLDGNLQEGEYRELTEKELANLWK